MSGKKEMLINITLDGHSGSGKSSTAKKVAEQLNYLYIDTGAMYRAVTFSCMNNGVDIQDEEELQNLLNKLEIRFEKRSTGNHTILNGQDIESEIRTQAVAERVSEVSRIPLVRIKLVEWQREMASGKGVVMEGRDAGTVVLPDAELKVFMTADLEVRAKRRWLEMKEKGKEVSLDQIMKNLDHRDQLDSSREMAPLRKAKGAVELDTTGMTFEEQVAAIVSLAREKMNQ